MSTDPGHWMAVALDLARQAAARGEVPVGAVVVRAGELLGGGANSPVTSVDPSAHAEILALRRAATKVGNYRLPGATLYVTVEPCAMCAGALVHARVAELVFAAPEPRSGAVISSLGLLDRPEVNHRVRWQQGPGAGEAAELMRQFFRSRRRNRHEPE